MLNNWLSGNKQWLILFGLISLLSCGKQQKPSGILPEDKMAQVLGEIYIVEEKVKKLSIAVDSSQQLTGLLTKHVLDSLSVPDSVFKNSLSYYWDHPNDMEDIYTALVDSLNLREQELSLPPKP